MPQRLRRLDGDSLGQDRVDRQAQIRVLLGRADRQHGAVVPAAWSSHLHPVHVGDAHEHSSVALVPTGTTLTGGAVSSFAWNQSAHRCARLKRIANVRTTGHDARPQSDGRRQAVAESVWLSFRANFIAHHFNQPLYGWIQRRYRAHAPEHVRALCARAEGRHHRRRHRGVLGPARRTPSAAPSTACCARSCCCASRTRRIAAGSACTSRARAAGSSTRRCRDSSRASRPWPAALTPAEQQVLNQPSHQDHPRQVATGRATIGKEPMP